MTEEEARNMLKISGMDDDTIDQMINTYNHRAQRLMSLSGPGINVIGVKPSPDDKDIYTVPIENTDLVIRMWEGGMGSYGQFCLDFFDRSKRTPVNLPSGYQIYPASTNMPGVFTTARPLGSWEKAFGYTPDKIPPGEEKWSVPAGAYLTIMQGRREVLTFSVPLTSFHQSLVQAAVRPMFGAGV